MTSLLKAFTVIFFLVFVPAAFAEEAEVDEEVVTAVDCSRLRFSGDVGASAVDTIQEKVLDCLDKNFETRLTITSPGGEVDYANAFFDAVMVHPNRRLLTTVATGGVSSAAVTMYMAGENRFITPNGNILIHMVSYGLNGNFTIRDIRELYDDAMLDQDILAKVVAERSGLEKKMVADAMSHGTTYSSLEALKLNLATALLN